MKDLQSSRADNDGSFSIMKIRCGELHFRQRCIVLDTLAVFCGFIG